MKQLLIAAFAFGITASSLTFANDFGHGHGGHGGHGRPDAKVMCTARNLRGQVFTARGSAFRRFEVQQRAVNKCVASGSAVCRATGCGRI